MKGVLKKGKGRCRNCGKWRRQRGRGKRKADEYDEKLANTRGDRPAQKKARAELAEYLGMSDDNKMSSEEVAARTGQPVYKEGVRVARDPTPHQAHGSQMGLLEAAAKYTRGPQFQSEAQFLAQEAAYGDRKVPVMIDGKPPDVTITDWKTLAGYPRLPIHPETKDVIWKTYQAPSRLPTMTLPSLGSIRSIVSNAFDAVMRTAPKVAKYAVENPRILLQLGALGLTIYKSWHYFGPILEKVFAALGWIANSGERANALGSAYLAAKNVPNMTQVTTAAGVVYADVPTPTQVIDTFGRELTAIVGAALGNPEAKENVTRVLDVIVKTAEDKPVAVEEEKGLLDKEWERMQKAIEAGLLPVTGGWSLLKGVFNRGQTGSGHDTSMMVYRHDLLDSGF